MDCSMPGFPILHYFPELICSNSYPLSRWCHPTISSSVIPFSSWPQSFLATGSFPMSQFFTSGSRSIGASASALVIPMNIWGWFPLGLTYFISLLSKGLSRVFSSTKFESITSLALNIFYDPTLTSIHIYWKSHSFGYMDLCQQSGVSAF